VFRFTQSAAIADPVSVWVAEPVEGVPKSMLITKLKFAASTFLVVSLACAGAGVSFGQLANDPAVPGQIAGKTQSNDANIQGTAQTKPSSVEQKLRSLLEERQTALRGIVSEKEAAFKNHGNVTFEEVANAKLAMLKAELDLTRSLVERVAVYQRMVALLKEVEDVAKRRVEAGRAPHYELLAAKANRLETEIALERIQLSPSIRPLRP
jgi:hypothetical protein